MSKQSEKKDKKPTPKANAKAAEKPKKVPAVKPAAKPVAKPAPKTTPKKDVKATKKAAVKKTTTTKAPKIEKKETKKQTGAGKQVKEKKSRKTPADLPAGLQKKEKKVVKKAKPNSVLFVKRPRQFHIGGDLPHPRDLSRMVKWPKYIRLQRKKKIMYQRLKIPAMINQFTSVLDKHSAKQVFKLVRKYRPETPLQRHKRLVGAALARQEKKQFNPTKPFVVKFGANHVTSLIEQKKAKLVVIANDVDPIEHVLWMPTLCRKMDVPYCIVKGKARLGTAVHLKTASCLAFVNVKPEDKQDFATVVAMCRSNYNERADQIVRAIGGGKLGLRSSVALKKRADALKKASLQKQTA